MNLSERGRGFVRKTLLTAALLSPFGNLTQPDASVQNLSLQDQNSLPQDSSNEPKKELAVSLPTPFQPSEISQIPTPKASDKEEISIPSDWVVVKSYTSDFTGSEDYRITNIIAGANALNNWFWDFDGSLDKDGNLNKVGKNVVKPRETFSINSILGGVEDYVWGKAIGPDLQPIKVYGGGICQIPTTMNVASMQSGLYIEERTNHSYYNGWYFGDPNDSKEFGMDATVYIPGVDLVVRNTYDYPIRFFFKVEEGHLRVDVIAPPELKPYYVELDGPYFYGTEQRVDEVGKYPWATTTIVTQNVWRDDSKKELLFTKPFMSYYQTSPYER